MCVNKTEICTFKVNDNIRWYNFWLGSLSIDLTKDKKSEVSLNGTVYGFLVEHSSIKKEDILSIHHSHRKRKYSLEGNLDRVLFAVELEFLKMLVPSLPQTSSNVNTECAGNLK